jgi:UDPglucose--hexose-1-phosphate uridylyltransferase
VVLYTPAHDATLTDLPVESIEHLVRVWRDRTRSLQARDDIVHVFPFENKGAAIGVTLSHPHGQIYAYPFVTPRTRTMLASARRHAGGNLFADVLAAERASGDRVIVENAHWTAFVPAVARWPYEIHIYPRRHVPDIPALSTAERDAFGPVYLEVLRRLDGLFGLSMPYIAAWHQAPVRVDRDLSYLHLQVFSIQRAPGKLKYLAGSESGMGVFVNDVRPEQAAQRLRDVVL